MSESVVRGCVLVCHVLYTGLEAEQYIYAYISDANFIRPLGPRVLIIGHSFVSRIDRHHLRSYFPSYWIIKAVGKPGAKVKDIRDTAVAHIYTFFPDLIYVQIGGNDIDVNTTPSLLLFELMETFSYLKNLGPFSLFVGGIFPRFKPRHIGADEYCRIKSFLNKQLYFWIQNFEKNVFLFY